MPASPDEGLELRPVVRGDAEVLFRWLNGADRRATSFQTLASVAWEEHVAWLDRHLADSRVWHALAVQDGEPAGQVRAEPHENGVVISIYVDAAFRRRGVGRRMIEAICRIAQERWPGVPLLAHVRPDNPGSIAFFERNNFTATQRQPDRVVLQRSL
jgi:ribosomal protein S18 acetylase RimI-like enzyme